MAEPGKEVLGALQCLPALEHAGGRELMPEKDVLGDREPVDDVQLLIHGGYAEPEGIHRGFDGY